MSFTLNTSNSASNGAAGTSITVGLTGVLAGDLIVLSFAATGDATTTTTVSDGTSSLVALTPQFEAADAFVQMFYLLASVATGSVTYTVTSPSVAGRSASVYCFTPTGAVTFDQENGAADAGTTFSSGNITTTGTDELVFGAESANQSYVSSTINGSASTGVIGAFSSQKLWYLAVSGTFTGDTSVTNSGGGRVTCVISSFKITSSASYIPPRPDWRLLGAILAQ